MLVLIPKLLAKIKIAINQFAKRNSQKISGFLMASKMVSVFFVFALLPMGGIKTERQTYQTGVKLDTNHSFALVSQEIKVDISTGRSRVELKELGLSHDPAEIKILIQEIAPSYGVDWRLVYAIGYHESGNYNSSLARRQNNFFGRKASSGGYASWSTPEEGIRNQFEYLKSRYFDRGLDTPVEINRVYAEDPGWYYRVESVMNTL